MRFLAFSYAVDPKQKKRSDTRWLLLEEKLSALPTDEVASLPLTRSTKEFQVPTRKAK